MGTTDRFGRPLGTLRVSVTDRCNLRCAYCMPETEYVWLPRADLLTFEEIDRLVAIFVSLGAERVRLTGGEPLLRRDLAGLVGRLAARPGLKERALTTNGVHLAAQADALRAAGLDRVTVSLDTLQAERFLRLSRSRDLDAVLAGIAAASAAFGTVKLDTVVIRGENDDELPALVEYAGRVGAEIRFIEYMDVGGATDWSASRVVPRTEIMSRLERAFGRLDSRATRRPRATRCRTARRSASSRRPPSRSAGIAIGPGSQRTASSSPVCTRPAVSTCADRCEAARATAISRR
jgi:cyclic pyranopterin phosphate synthase